MTYLSGNHTSEGYSLSVGVDEVTEIFPLHDGS